MKRKLTAFITAVLVLLSALSMSASAVNKSSVVIDALYESPEIIVTVPLSGEVYINPYRLPVAIDGIDGEEQTAQIVSTPASIENESEMPLGVDVTVIGKVNEGSDMGLSTSTTDGLTSKKAFIYFEMQAASDPNNVTWDSEYDVDKHLVVRTTSKTKKQIVTLAQADKPNHYGAFRLAGDCVPAPKNLWTEADGLTVEIAFTFTPLLRDNT